MGRLSHHFATLMLLALLGSCTHFGAYEPDLRQGNELEPAKIAALHPGMNQARVAKNLGLPITEDPYNSLVWTYVFRVKHHRHTEAHFLKIDFSPQKTIMRIQMDAGLKAQLPENTA